MLILIFQPQCFVQPRLKCALILSTVSVTVEAMGPHGVGCQVAKPLLPSTMVGFSGVS